MYICKNPDGFVYLNIVSRPGGECNSTIYCSDINRSIIVSGLEAIREDGTIIRTVGRVRPVPEPQ